MTDSISPDSLASLGAKLDALDLTPSEAAALHAVIDAAEGAEVDGFLYFEDSVRTARFSDRLGSVLGAGFTAPGDVAGFTAPGDVAGAKPTAGAPTTKG